MTATLTTLEVPIEKKSYVVFFVGRLMFASESEARAAAGMAATIRGEPAKIEMVDVTKLKRNHFATVTERLPMRTKKTAGKFDR